jgi:glyoxylate/hydroxypyruvate reductase A
MNILYYSTFSNQEMWLKILKKKFKGHRIFTIKDNFDFKKIEIAIVWNLPNSILKKISNIKVIFSLGAGVDHILKLSNFNHTPIIRIKDPNMRERMLNHVLSQILNYQLKLNFYQRAQQRNIWLDERKTPLNNEIIIGILGLGYIGEFVAKKLEKLNYKVVGYKNTISKSKSSFEKFNGKKLNHFISISDIVVSILPSTKETENFINKKFLSKMKKNSLLINIGRGACLNEIDLINHLKLNHNFFASLDVFKKEPLNKNHKFWNHPNITITPHIAAITDIESSIEYMYKSFLEFRKKNKIASDVSLKKGY